MSTPRKTTSKRKAAGNASDQAATDRTTRRAAQRTDNDNAEQVARLLKRADDLAADQAAPLGARQVTPRKTTGKRTTRKAAQPAAQPAACPSAQPTRDDRKQTLLKLIEQLDQSDVAVISALGAALLDSQDGLLLIADEQSLRAAIADMHATGRCDGLEHWLIDNHYLHGAESGYVYRHNDELMAQERAQGANDGE
jgi:hypothetical protein